jgi:RNA polymerase sigma-B factor
MYAPPCRRPATGPADDLRLLRRYHEDHDPRDRAALLVRWRPLALSVAHRYAGRGEPLDDLIQVAMLGLLLALDRYDPDRGPTFSSYAVPTITGEVRRHFRDRTWPIHVSRSVQELCIQLDAASAAHAARTGHDPSTAELAGALQKDPAVVEEALGAWRTRSAPSVYSPVTLGEEDAPAMIDQQGGRDGGYSSAEARAILAPLIVDLPPRLRRILALRYGGDLTQSQIAAQIGVSQMQVSRLLRQALEALADEADRQRAELQPAQAS